MLLQSQCRWLLDNPPLNGYEISPIVIQENSHCKIGDYDLEILSHLGQFCDIYYYKVTLSPSETESDSSNYKGLLRIGASEGKLKAECQLREILGNHKMISKLLVSVKAKAVCLGNTNQENSPLIIDKNEENPENLTEVLPNEAAPEINDDYLPEEYYEDSDIELQSEPEKLILLTELPPEEETLEFWLKQAPSLPNALLISSQVCQFFRYLYQYKWCMVSLLPQYIRIGTPLQFFDLTTAYPVGEKISLISDYCAPELLYNSCPVDEYTSTYLVGMILYQAVHQTLPPRLDNLNHSGENIELTIQKIPRIYQILKIALSSLPDERFSLSQLLNLLVKTRQSLETSTVQWEIAASSTIGLSTNRLQNEDSYGFRQPSTSQSEAILLGVIADGMGGMAQGEIASQIAVKTVLEAPLAEDFSTREKRANWLISIVNKANKAVSRNVRNGGTTLSIVLTINQELNIAHVGDSRIYLLRNGRICQLSEDHSYVAMLLASGQISYEESLTYENRSTLTKSLGDKSRLSDGYIQDLSRFGGELSLKLEEGDILILCSDGVWDLVPPEELAELFEKTTPLQKAVNQTIEKVLEKGANDNATILSLKCHVEPSKL